MTTSERATPPVAWLLRATWAILPIAIGPAVAKAVDDWSAAQRGAAETALWSAWGVGLVAVLAPRPWGLTAVRLGSGWSLGLSLAALPSTDAVTGAGALAASLLTVSLATLPETATWMANGAAYRNERRLPLRTPPVIAVLLAPLAVLLTGAALAAGPLLLADKRWLPGALALALGIPVALTLLRSMQALSRRWLVLVPGGIVVHDPLTLAHSVLLPREALAGVDPLPTGAANDAVDLRLGARGGAVEIRLSDPVPLPVADRARRRTTLVHATRVLVALARPGVALRLLTSGNGAVT